MVQNLFIGLILAIVMYFDNFLDAVILAIIIAYLLAHAQINLNFAAKMKQQAILDKIIATKVDQYSKSVIGYFNGHDIHEYIISKNPGSGKYHRYDYIDIIYYNARGHAIGTPKQDEIWLNTGLIYKDTGIEFKPTQK